MLHNQGEIELEFNTHALTNILTSFLKAQYQDHTPVQ